MSPKWHQAQGKYNKFAISDLIGPLRYCRCVANLHPNFAFAQIAGIVSSKANNFA